VRKPPSCKKKECGAPVIWAITVRGARMPFDKQRDASQTSKYAVSHGADGKWYVRTLEPGDELARGEYRHMPHYATCAAAARTPVPGDGDGS